MRAVDSPYTPSNGVVYSRLRRLRGVDAKLFRSSPRYKESEPYMEDCCLWREDVLDYLVVVPPGYR